MSEKREIDRRLDRIEHAIRLLACAVIRDQNDLNALLRRLSEPTTALSGTTVTVKAP